LSSIFSRASAARLRTKIFLFLRAKINGSTAGSPISPRAIAANKSFSRCYNHSVEYFEFSDIKSDFFNNSSKFMLNSPISHDGCIKETVPGAG